MKKYIFTIAILALGLTACNKEKDSLQETPEQTPAVLSEAPVCFFNLPASFDGDGATKAVTIGESTATSSFELSDKVYVYIERASDAPAFGYDESTSELVPLTISNINGKTCDLEGALKFYYNGGSDVYTPQENDIVHLLYNHNGNLDNPDYPYFEFYSMSGDKDGYIDMGYFNFWGADHFDFAEAIMKVTAVSGDAGSGYSLTLGKVDDPMDTEVSFKSLQSLFRQRLSFTDEGGDPVTPTVTKFRINSANNKIIYSYYPFYDNNTPHYDYQPLEIGSPYSNPVISGDGDIYFPLMFNDENKNDALIFTVYDDAENVYTVTKNAPASGFANGKYYYGGAALAWHHNLRPTVTGTTAVPSNGVFTIVDDPVNITISGYSEDYHFQISEGRGGTITLDNVTATHSGDKFINQVYTNPAGDISLVLTGANSISCGSMWGVLVYGDLKLSCTGTSATLTVTDTYDSSCGLSCSNYRCDVLDSNPAYNRCNVETEVDVTDLLAAPGFTVIRSARTDNADGTYTWTYTVTAPAYYAATAGDIGKVIGADGNIYATADAATAASTSAIAMIAFIGNIDGVCNHGMAISLTDIESYQMTYAQATGEYAIPVWAAAHPIAGGTWRLPSESDWQRMMWGYYAVDPAATDISTFQTKLSAAGGTALVDGAYYWTSTVVDTENAKTVFYGAPYAGIQSVVKTFDSHVRACLSF